jgi:DNA mismatch repair protein MutL
VVKELVENSIDALASRIDVAVEAGGAPFIRVRDNGMGMTAGEVVKAVLPHATSKIQDFEDLVTLDTLGFRGEALPSIASVAELEIISRPSDNVAGALCRWEAGICVEQKTCGSPIGTTVTVRRLFERVPARLKFLKSNGTEFGLIADMMGKLAMTRPDIAFTLAHPERVVFQTSGSGELRDVLAEILDKELARNLIQVGGIYEGLSVGGFIAPPHLARSAKNFQTFIINKRVVRSKVLSQALREGYHTFVPSGSHPAAVLVLALDQGSVDINVHPAKTEIKFHEERLIIERLRETIRQALGRMWLGTESLALTPETAAPAGTVNPADTIAPAEADPAKTSTAAEKSPSISPANPGQASAPSVSSDATGTNPVDSGEVNATSGMASRDEPDISSPSPEMIAENPSDYQSSGELPVSDQLAKKINSLTNKKNPRVHFGEGSSITQFLTESSDGGAARNRAPGAGRQDSGTGKQDSDSVRPGSANGSGDNETGTAHGTGTFEAAMNWTEQELFLPVNENEVFFQSLRPLAQLFSTYIVAEGRDALYLIDQHAAHERIRYEEFLEQANKSESASQMLLTPLVVHLTLREEQAMLEHLPQLREMGFLVEDFGAKTYLLRGVPVGSGQPEAEEVFHRFLDEVLTNATAPSLPDLLEKWIFVLACRNSVKAHDALSLAEMSELLRKLGKVSNPYSCPHGRPLLIPFPRQELEKRFGR